MVDRIVLHDCLGDGEPTIGFKQPDAITLVAGTTVFSDHVVGLVATRDPRDFATRKYVKCCIGSPRRTAKSRPSLFQVYGEYEACVVHVFFLDSCTPRRMAHTLALIRTCELCRVLCAAKLDH